MSVKPQSAPCLLKDLVKYTPPHLKGFEQPLRDHCQHVYTIVPERSFLPKLDERPEKGNVWQAEALCQHCRMHLELRIDFEKSDQACPCEDFPLHVFSLSVQNQTQDSHDFEFYCSSPPCRTKMEVKLRAPRLSSTDVWTLTDEVGLKQRFRSCQDRSNVSEPYSAAMAMSTFRSYVKDSVNSASAKKIPSENKRFKMALGNDARALLLRLGFTFEPPQNGQGFAFWCLPGPGPFLKDEDKLMLQDVADELTLLIQQRPDAERAKAGEPANNPTSGMKDFERILGCLDYEKFHPFTRDRISSNEKQAPFTGIGALPDFSDALVTFCFDRQMIYDPDNIPYYFQCLKDIAASRPSEALGQKISLLDSQGLVSQTEVEQAYQYFGLKVEDQEGVRDQQLLDSYQARVPDLSREQRAAAKEALAKIAKARNSRLLKDATSDKMETYDQALAYLGVREDTDENYIINVASVKRSEDEVASQLVPKALEIIATKRNSSVLRSEARQPGSGTLAADMTPQHAYTLLGVENPQLVDDETIITSHTFRVSDAPGRASEYNEALSVISRERNSEHLRLVASSLSGNAVHVGPADGYGRGELPITEPRGLNNIGNTCYLNSLLQYLFTIKPVRDMVEDFEDFKEVLPSEGETWAKKVADMKVDRAGVQRTQAFVNRLSKLFQILTTTRATCATPEVELARLTLEKAIAARVEEESETKSPTLTDKMRRRSTISGPGLTLLKTRSTSTGNVLGSAKPQRPDSGYRNSSASPSKKPRTDSEASTATTIIAEEGEPKREDVEMPDAKTVSSPPQYDDVSEPLDAGRASLDSAKQEPNGQVTGTIDLAQEANELVKDQPPPIPPRPTNKAQIEEYAMQQDVQEVMNNVFHQLQWAIKPRHITELGNQEDVVSDTFWGLITEHSITANGKKESTSQDFNVLPAYVNEPCDIYDALSATFDRDIWDDRTAYWTIGKAPPVMHFQIPRIGFNAEKKIEERNTNQCKLHQTIYLDRFMAGEEVLRKRELFWRYRDMLKERKASRERLKPHGRDQSVGDSLSSLGEYLKGLKDEGEELGINFSVDEPGLHESLAAEAKHADTELAQVDHEIAEIQDRMDDVFSKTSGNYKYGLQAVFVHRGSTRSGHWYTYMYDPRDDKWRKYNDEDVEVISNSRVQDEIHAPNEVLRGTTALAVYALEKEWQTLFDPVHRNPEPEPEPVESAAWVDGAQQVARSQIIEMPPANVPYQGATADERREAWDVDRQIADSAVKW